MLYSAAERQDVVGFTIILRDIMVILAAAALILMSAFGALVFWQLYRLGRELQAEMQPILASVQDTTDTVRGTAEFVSQRMSSRFSGLVALGYSAKSFYQLIQQFVNGLRQLAATRGSELPATLPPAGGPPGALPAGSGGAPPAAPPPATAAATPPPGGGAANGSNGR